jgi:hypothetical protein
MKYVVNTGHSRLIVEWCTESGLYKKFLHAQMVRTFSSTYAVEFRRPTSLVPVTITAKTQVVQEISGFS